MQVRSSNCIRCLATRDIHIVSSESGGMQLVVPNFSLRLLRD
jgi:hypothetical protein